MPEITVPEVRLPKALREMRRDDIQHAISDVRLPKAVREFSGADLQRALADVRLPAIELPERITMPRVELDTKAIERRLPGRRQRRSRLPFLIVGAFAVVALGWFLMMSTPLGERVRNLMRSRSGTGYETADGSIAASEDAGSYGTGPRAVGTGVPESAASRSGVAVGPGRAEQVDQADQDQIQPAL